MTTGTHLDPSTPADRSALVRTMQGFLQVAARLGALLLIILYFRYQVGPAFFKAGNVENILMQSAVYAMAGLGMTMVIITGGIDLAAGSTIALAMVVTSLMLNTEGHRAKFPADLVASKDQTRLVSHAGEAFHISQPLRSFEEKDRSFEMEFASATTSWKVSVKKLSGAADASRKSLSWTLLSVLAGAASGAAIGLIQGLMITGLRLVPFIVTLGGFQWIRGMTKGIADNQEISPPSSWLYENLMFPVQGQQFNWQLFPAGVWLTALAALLTSLMLRYTRLGRRIYAVGSNEATARLCGLPVARTKITVYCLAGLFAGLAGVLEFSKLNLGQPTGAMTYELYVIAACVIGGTSLMGGVGTIFGTMVGALIIGTLYAGAQQAGWEKWVQEAAIGFIIIIAVALDQMRVRRMKV